MQLNPISKLKQVHLAAVQQQPPGGSFAQQQSLTLSEIVLRIFSYLKAKELALSLRVCRHWYQLGSDSTLWASLLQHDFNQIASQRAQSKVFYQLYSCKKTIIESPYKNKLALLFSRIAFSSDSKKLVIGYHQAMPSVWYSQQGRYLFQLGDHLSRLCQFVSWSLSSDDKIAIAAYGEITICSLSGSFIRKLTAYRQVQEMTFLPKRHNALAIFTFNKIDIVDVQKGHHLYSLDTVLNPTAFADDGTRFAYSTTIGHIYFWYPQQLGVEPRSIAFHRYVRRLTFSPEGNLLISTASAYIHSSCKIWDLQTSPVTCCREFLAGCASFSPCGKKIALGLSDGSVEILDRYSFLSLCRYKCHSDIVTTLSFAPCGYKLASCANDGLTYIYHLPQDFS